MKEAKFKYKCRRCGEIDSSLCTGEGNAERVLIYTVLGIEGSSTEGHHVKLIDTHRCKDGGRGVTDLIGFAVKEEE